MNNATHVPMDNDADSPTERINSSFLNKTPKKRRNAMDSGPTDAAHMEDAASSDMKKRNGKAQPVS